MHKTRVLGSLKSIFPPLHQPLPLDKRECQRLLDAIKASFREQLDREYGFAAPAPSRSSLPSQPPRITSLPSSSSSSSSSSNPTQAHPDQIPTRPTDRHMHAILRNPLFNPASASEPPPGGYGNALDRHKAIFEKAVSRGLMNLTRAHGFLEQVYVDTKTLDMEEGLQPTGAGVLVAQWLRSSGQERDLSFLSNVRFARLLVRFMVADGLDGLVWSWFERLITKPEAPSPGTGPTAAYVIDLLVFRKYLAPEPDQAYAAMLKAEGIVKEHHAHPKVLRRAWSKLAFHTTMPNTIVRRQPPVDLFDPFVAMGEEVGSTPVEMAHLDLHHPAHPSADRAVEYLSKEDSYKTSDASSRLSPSRYLARLRWLGLDTVQHLMKENETREATRIWNLLQRHLGNMSLGFRDPVHGNPGWY
ncbi:hypothetical protein VTJ83DRAFT_4386 [Remersonia thermophila]|uniref:Uncharacterized protein n=1 Tax=Remersonia thermophila TaxID=72144 RepID=A0ABR4DAQ3_9PEZI